MKIVGLENPEGPIDDLERIRNRLGAKFERIEALISDSNESLAGQMTSFRQSMNEGFAALKASIRMHAEAIEWETGHSRLAGTGLEEVTDESLDEVLALMNENLCRLEERLGPEESYGNQ
ncbi:MAG: hypothetical protein ACLQU1_22365 [Bryobacteraceae bacterium]